MGLYLQSRDLSKTDQDIRTGGTQIEYKDQDSEIHDIFTAECGKRGTEVKLTF